MVKHQSDINEDLLPERMELASEDVLSRVVSYNLSYTVSNISDMISHGDINVTPEFQRDFLWDLKKASLFVDSLLVGLPTPSLILGKRKSDDKYIVIDGQQRLLTIMNFLAGRYVFGERYKPFALTGLHRRPWNGKAFDGLNDDIKRRFLMSVINIIIIEDIDNNPNVIYDIFLRLNTGGIPLNDQEIRNAIYHGPLKELINVLNENTTWRTLYGTTYHDKRLKDRELILRFFALVKKYKEYSPPMSTFLTRFWIEYNQQYSDLGRYADLFYSTTDLIINELGPRTFRPNKFFNKALFDSVMVAVAKLISNRESVYGLKHKFGMLMNHDEYLHFIRERTNSPKSVYGRINLALSFLSGHH
jgi:uncharacterized protein with ParB-like and HNH nuclease domain